MSAFSGRDEALAVKLVSFYPEAKDHQTHQAWVMIFNPATGNLTAVSDTECMCRLVQSRMNGSEWFVHEKSCNVKFVICGYIIEKRVFSAG